MGNIDFLSLNVKLTADAIVGRAGWELLPHDPEWERDIEPCCRSIVRDLESADAATHDGVQAILEVLLPEHGLPTERILAVLFPPPNPRLRTLRQRLDDPEAMRSPEVVMTRLGNRGRTTLVAAREKLGKSTLLTAGIAAVSRGSLFLGERCPRGPVLWLIAEEHPNDFIRRAEAFGADPDRVHLLDHPLDAFKELEAAMHAVCPVVVVIDTLATFAADLVDDPHASSGWIPVMQTFSRLAREYDAAVVLLHHSRKSDGQYRDSTAIGAGVDMLLEMAMGDEAGVRRLKVKSRWAATDYAVRFEGDHFSLSAGELSLEARILSFIEGHPGASLRAVREEVGGRSADVGRVLEALLSRGAIRDEGDDTHHVYRVPSAEKSEARNHCGNHPRDSLQVVAEQGPEPLREPGGSRPENPVGCEREPLPPADLWDGPPAEPPVEEEFEEGASIPFPEDPLALAVDIFDLVPMDAASAKALDEARGLNP